MLKLGVSLSLSKILTNSTMKHFILFLFTLLSGSLSAQMLKGKILDINDKPISNATIYIREKTLGIMADDKGQFQTSLEQGDYTIEFRSIGYESQIKKVTIPQKGLEMQINLVEKPILLNEITVNRSKEDPAYQIMRNVIARAPFHLHQLDSYTAEIYMKRGGKIEKIPALMKMSMPDKSLLSLVGKLLIFESKNIVNYTSPNKYKQKVVAFKSSFPKEFEPKKGVSISTSSIYSSYFLGNVSPLSSQTFQYYKFKYMDVFQSGEHQIFKISFQPKIKSYQLSSGTLYVVDGEWSIYSAEFKLTDMGEETHVKINYQEVKPDVFLPITFEETSNINLLGIKGNSHGFSSTKYTVIKVNPKAVNAKPDKTVEIKKENLSKEKQKALAQLEKLSEKEKINTVDAIKVAKLTSVLNTVEDTVKQKKSLEIKPYKSPIEIEKDTLANQRDSAYWNNIRTVPIQAEEELSYKQVDSFPQFKNVTSNDEGVSIEAKTSSKASWLIGGKNKLNNFISVYYDGLLGGCLTEYNFVDGFWLGQKAGLDFKTSKATKFNIEPSIYYATARKSVIWKVNLAQEYAPMKNGLFWLSLGNTSQDIMQEKGISRLYNGSIALTDGTNGISFYQKKYISAENSIDLANGLKFSLGGSYENRSLLQNNTSFNFFNKFVKPNFPEDRILEFPNHTNTSIWSKLEWTPRYFYQIKDGKKKYLFSRYPTFTLQYTKAFPLTNSISSEYDKINLSVKQTVKTGLSDRFMYNINVGGFLSKKQLFAPDYNYFSTIPIGFTNRTFTETFALLPNYNYINDKWWESHFTYHSEHLLLKRIPFLQTKAFSESVHLNTLWDYKGRVYNEVGYSIGFTENMRIGVFSSFTGVNYNNTGIRINLSLPNKY